MRNCYLHLEKTLISQKMSEGLEKFKANLNNLKSSLK